MANSVFSDVLSKSAQGKVSLQDKEKAFQWNSFLSALDSNPKMSDSEAMERFAKTLSVARSDWKDYNDNTLLMHMASRGRLGIVKRLIHELYADVNASNKDGTTALHMAARSGNRDICTELLDSGADATKKDRNEQTAAMIARNCGYKEVSDSIKQEENSKYFFRLASHNPR